MRVAAARGLVDAGMTAIAEVGAVTAIMRQEGVDQYGERTALAWGMEPGKRYTGVTTALHETQEQEFIRLAKAANADRSAAISGSVLYRKVAEFGLDILGGCVMGTAAACGYREAAVWGTFRAADCGRRRR